MKDWKLPEDQCLLISQQPCKSTSAPAVKVALSFFPVFYTPQPCISALYSLPYVCPPLWFSRPMTNPFTFQFH